MTVVGNFWMEYTGWEDIGESTRRPPVRTARIWRIPFPFPALERDYGSLLFAPCPTPGPPCCSRSPCRALGLPCSPARICSSYLTVHIISMIDSRTEEEANDGYLKKELDDDEELSHNENVATVEAVMFEISSISLYVVLQIVTMVQQQATVVTGGSEI